ALPPPSYPLPTPPFSSTLFPYTTLFRSFFALGVEFKSGVDVRFGINYLGQRDGAARAAKRVARVGVLQLYHGANVSGIQAERHRSEEHTSELQSLRHLVCRLLLEKKNKN